MNDFLAVTIGGNRVLLTRKDADFLAEHLDAALQTPAGKVVNFTRKGTGRGVSIRIERGTPAQDSQATILTDC